MHITRQSIARYDSIIFRYPHERFADCEASAASAVVEKRDDDCISDWIDNGRVPSSERVYGIFGGQSHTRARCAGLGANRTNSHLVADSGFAGSRLG